VIPFCRPNAKPTQNLMCEIHKVLASGRLALGPKTKELEARVAAFVGAKYAVAVSSGTAGLMLAVKAVDAKRVAVPSFTYMASVHAIKWAGATPFFVDISSRSLCMSPRSFAEATEGTVCDAIMSVAAFGHPVEVPKTPPYMIVDACSAFGVPHNKHVLMTVYSLGPTKQVTGCQGGVIVTNEGYVARRLRIMRRQGYEDGNRSATMPGLNAQLSEVHAAIALSQDFSRAVESRKRVFLAYRALLGDLKDVTLTTFPEDHTALHFPIMVKDREAFLDRLEGIEVQTYFDPPCHLQEAFKHEPRLMSLQTTEHVARRIVCLPVIDMETAEEVSRRVKAALEVGSGVLAATAD